VPAQSYDQLQFDTAVFSFVATDICKTQVDIFSHIDFLLIITKCYSRISRSVVRALLSTYFVMSGGCSSLYMHTIR
jgi:hypothetical protein